jgi:hypothetical protein
VERASTFDRSPFHRIVDGYLTALERSEALPADISPGRNPGEHRGTPDNHLLARLPRNARFLV